MPGGPPGVVRHWPSTYHLKFLDVAVEDHETAGREFAAASAAWQSVMARFNDLDQAVEAGSSEREALAVAGTRLHYRIDCAYAEARRVLDRLVVVVNSLLPRSQTDLGNSHANFHRLLERRCEEIGVSVPESLLCDADDLNARIKRVRDRLEHAASPLSMRGVTVRGETITVAMWRPVQEGGDPEEMQLESATVLRDAIDAYLRATLDLLERVAARPRT